jgi:hypothetical protein
LPLGTLQAAVRPDRLDRAEDSPLLKPMTVGLGTTLSPTRAGTLYLRVNDSPAELADNAGEIEVTVRKGP